MCGFAHQPALAASQPLQAMVDSIDRKYGRIVAYGNQPDRDRSALRLLLPLTNRTAGLRILPSIAGGSSKSR
jgi:hypothetical protein